MALKNFQRAKIMEESGRLWEAISLYEAAGKLDKAALIRYKLKAMETGTSASTVQHTTYNIQDSAIAGGINREAQPIQSQNPQSDQRLSEDGEWMWNGSEWVPTTK